MTAATRLRIGFIPLVDAAALIVAADAGFAAAEGIDLELVPEVSWSNVRDKLNIGLFDAAHLLTPVAIASSLGLGHVRVPLVAPFVLGLNGNAITVSPSLFSALAAVAEGDLTQPLVSAQALAHVVAERRRRGAESLTFGMTFPFSFHNYQLRFWMAAGGVDPDEDVRLVVLPPPYMVDSLAGGHVDGFCVGAPWNSIAVQLGIGRILHFGSEIMARAAEKVLALRASWVADNVPAVAALLRALSRAGEFVNDPANREEVAGMLAPADRVGVEAETIARTLAGELIVSPEGLVRRSARYIIIGGREAALPDPVQAAWIYAQMVRWRQAPHAPELLAAARSVFRPDLHRSALGPTASPTGAEPRDGVGAFAGPPFDPGGLPAHLAAWPEAPIAPT